MACLDYVARESDKDIDNQLCIGQWTTPALRIAPCSVIFYAHLTVKICREIKFHPLG